MLFKVSTHPATSREHETAELTAPSAPGAPTVNASAARRLESPASPPRPSDDGNWLDASVWNQADRERERAYHMLRTAELVNKLSLKDAAIELLRDALAESEAELDALRDTLAERQPITTAEFLERAA